VELIEREGQAVGYRRRMDLVRVESGTESPCQVSGTLWRRVVLTSFVLAACLASIVVLALF